MVVTVPYESFSQYRSIVDWLIVNVGVRHDGSTNVESLITYLSEGEGWRVSHRTLNDELRVEFESEELATLFLLRWT